MEVTTKTKASVRYSDRVRSRRTSSFALAIALLDARIHEHSTANRKGWEKCPCLGRIAAGQKNCIAKSIATERTPLSPLLQKQRTPLLLGPGCASSLLSPQPTRSKHTPNIANLVPKSQIPPNWGLPSLLLQGSRLNVLVVKAELRLLWLKQKKSKK